MTGNLHKGKYTFFIIPRAVLLRMRNVEGYSVMMATLNILFTLEIQTQWDIDCYKMKIRTFFLKAMPFMRQCGKYCTVYIGHR